MRYLVVAAALLLAALLLWMPWRTQATTSPDQTAARSRAEPDQTLSIEAGKPTTAVFCVPGRYHVEVSCHDDKLQFRVPVADQFVRIEPEPQGQRLTIRIPKGGVTAARAEVQKERHR